ncbi:hypothetical protein [Thermocoleostomius sinensis]|uniref:Uncharacterized protein n=1 Tax=Thermocoleostomius sinensis A174 TaxID=2016057 RepID=A0A9E9C7Y4_9CYAN|nr:hypothetical protein [Thermocoleostomius sinensis]WAL60844.1 hypothetical protein OXH18_02275 [Thermocoleostomius sinensis A174]
MQLRHGGGGMRWVAITAMMAIAALPVSGCDSLVGQGDPSPEDESAEINVTASDEAPGDTTVESPAAEALPPDAPLNAPLPDETRVTRLPSNLDLIPSTNPDQRVQAIQTERTDPFSLVPTTPSVQIEISPTNTPSTATQPTATAPSGTSPGSGTVSSAPATRSTNGGQSTATNGTSHSSGGLAPIPNLVPRTPTAVAPLPPQPTLARAVEVLGVVQIGNVPYAIVNAPNEPTSRYVREGQSLANGQVIVRRIDALIPEPIVVFEQFGIEVTTTVGQATTTTTSPSPAATVSVEQPFG